MCSEITLFETELEPYERLEKSCSLVKNVPIGLYTRLFCQVEWAAVGPLSVFSGAIEVLTVQTCLQNTRSVVFSSSYRRYPTLAE